MVLGLGDFNGHVERRIDGFEGVHGGYGIGKRNVEGRRLLEFCDEKELYVANTWFEKNEQRKITHIVWVEMKLRLTLHWSVKTIESIQKT